MTTRLKVRLRDGFLLGEMQVPVEYIEQKRFRAALRPSLKLTLEDIDWSVPVTARVVDFTIEEWYRRPYVWRNPQGKQPMYVPGCFVFCVVVSVDDYERLVVNMAEERTDYGPFGFRRCTSDERECDRGTICR